MATVVGERAKRLLQQLNYDGGEAGALRLPRYDETGVRVVLAECNALHDRIQELMGDNIDNVAAIEDPVKVALVVHHQTVLRNKRCLLAYLQVGPHSRCRFDGRSARASDGCRVTVSRIARGRVRVRSRHSRSSSFSAPYLVRAARAASRQRAQANALGERHGAAS